VALPRKRYAALFRLAVPVGGLSDDHIAEAVSVDITG